MGGNGVSEEKDDDFLGYGVNTLNVSQKVSSSLYYVFAGYYGVDRGALLAMSEEAHNWSNRKTNQGFAIHARIMISSIYPTFNYYDWYGFSRRCLTANVYNATTVAATSICNFMSKRPAL